MEPLLLLVAEPQVDLSPLTRHLWAERIAHRVVEQNGKQCLYVADPADAGRVQQWLDEWRRGELAEPLPEAVQPGIQQALLGWLATPVSVLLLLLFIAVFIWMQFSAAWQVWLQSGAAYWPQQRFNPAVYFDMGLWALWRPTLLHFSLLHILFNGLWWWILARRIERLDGIPALLALTFICGLAGNMVQWWYAGPSFGGVSGVTLGMLGWVGVRLKRVPYQVPRMLLPVMVGWLLLTMGADTLLPGLSGTAHGAHIGGLIAGFILAALWPVRHFPSDRQRGFDDA